jgi:hypothetical protein
MARSSLIPKYRSKIDKDSRPSLIPGPDKQFKKIGKLIKALKHSINDKNPNNVNVISS